MSILGSYILQGKNTGKGREGRAVSGVIAQLIARLPNAGCYICDVPVDAELSSAFQPETNLISERSRMVGERRGDWEIGEKYASAVRVYCMELGRSIGTFSSLSLPSRHLHEVLAHRL